jgi:hypothetical protein
VPNSSTVSTGCGRQRSRELSLKIGVTTAYLHSERVSMRQYGAMAKIPDDVLDRLYGAPPEEFVASRNAAARELKQGGDDEAAQAVQALRRPAAPAAAINRAVRAAPAQSRALLDAANDLRRAHEAAMAGDPDRGALKAAVAAERQAVGALARTAAAQVAGDGQVSADLERRIHDTLEAVALDPGVREQFTAGRLEKDTRAAGLAMDVPTSPAAARRTEKRQRQEEQRRRQEAVNAAQQSVERRTDEVEQAKRTRERADADLRDARARLKEAQAELRKARRRLG